MILFEMSEHMLEIKIFKGSRVKHATYIPSGKPKMVLLLPTSQP